MEQCFELSCSDFEVCENITSVSQPSSWYRELFYEKADRRVRDRWLMGDPLPIVSIYLFYIFFTVYLLPRFMRDRKPFDVDRAFVVLNIIILVTSTYFVVQAFVPWVFIYNWRCEPMDWSESELAMKAVNACYFFLISKFIYTFESLLIGLKKNTSYRAAYFLIHHSTLPMIVWFVANYSPGGHATFAGFINSLQHLLLFSYRLIFVDIFPSLSRRMFNLRKPIGLWLSILQWVLIFGHTFQLYFWNSCRFPMTFVYGISFYVTFITILLIVMVVPQM